ncbi:MAG: hypothetical protein U9P90_00775 [Patescibacteria group bacterium]|nr:hypothetical protein [Patescibacteria group bacterium]
MRLQNTIEKQNETKKLLQENLKVSKAILKITEKTRRYIFWSQVASWFKLFLIVVPIILAVLYLPSLIGKWQAQIQDIFPFGSVQQFQGASGLLDQLQK